MPIILTDADAALLSRQFNIDDPRGLPDLLASTREDFEVPEVEFRYDAVPKQKTRDDKPDVWCVFCHEHNHWKGFVMKYPDGSRITVGKDCALKLFGLNFKDLERQFDAMEDRQSILLDFLEKLPALPRLAEYVDELSKHTSYRILASTQAHILKNFEFLVEALRPAVRNSETWLMSDELVRDHDAEEARRQRNVRAKAEMARMVSGLSPAQIEKRIKRRELPQIEDESRSIMATVEHRAMLLRGGLLLKFDFQRQSWNFTKRAMFIRGMYEALQGKSSKTIDRKTLMIFQERLDHTIRQNEAEMFEFEKMLAFFEADHLQTLASWASKKNTCEGVYTVEDGGLVYSPRFSGHDRAKVILPVNFALPDSTRPRVILADVPKVASLTQSAA